MSETESQVSSGSGVDSPSSCEVENAVVDFIRDRGRIGRVKYRCSMDRKDFTLDEWVRHLQEELADALQYGERIKTCGYLLEQARLIMLSLESEKGLESAGEWLRLYEKQFSPEVES